MLASLADLCTSLLLRGEVTDMLEQGFLNEERILMYEFVFFS